MLYTAVEDAAQIVDGSDVNGLVFAELIDGGAGDVVCFDERVGRFVGVLERIPERCIRNHTSRSFLLDGFIIRYDYLLDYSLNKDYNE